MRRISREKEAKFFTLFKDALPAHGPAYRKYNEGQFPPALDVLVIGAGTAGEYAAEAAKKNTGSVGIIEKGKVEGECIFHACIPIKALGHAARTYKKMKTADFFGLPVLTENADYKKVKAFKDSIIDDMSEGLDDELTEAGIKLFRGDARFIFPIEVAVGDEIITAKKSLSPPVHCRPHPRYRVWQKQVISRTSKRLNWKKYRSDWLLSAAAPSGWSSPRRT